MLSLSSGISRLAVMVAVPIITIGTAAAQTPVSPRRACAPDIEKFCSGVQPGGGRIMACMKAHAADLSPDFKAAAASHASTGG